MVDRPAASGTLRNAPGAAERGHHSEEPRSRPRLDFILDLLKVRREELGRATLYLLYFLFAVSVFVLGRNVAAALFLSNYGSAALPWMYVASAATVALAAWSYSRVTGRVRLDRLIIGTVGGMVVVLTVLRAAMWMDASFVYPVLYVLVEVMGALLVIQFWSLANATHHTREAKRLFGFIGAGGVLANILVGFGGAALVMRIGTENLVFVMIGCLLCCLVLVVVLGKGARQQLTQALDGPVGAARKRGMGISQRTKQVFGSRHLRLVAIIVALTFVVTTLVDFQFKALANQAFDREGLTAFFSLLYGFTGLLALVLQFFVTGRLLERFGVLLALSLLPIFLVLGSGAIFIAPLALVAAFAKGADAVFRYSVNDVTLQLLYLPVPPQSRMKSKAFIDGILKPLAYGLTGLALALALRAFPGLEGRIHWLALVSGSVAIVWLWLVTRLRGAYLSSLVDTLRSRRLDLHADNHRLDDSSAFKVLGAVLDSEEDVKVMRALDLLDQLQARALDAKVETLLARPNPRVREMALAHLGQSGSLRWADSVRALFADPDRSVAASAIQAYCAIGKEKAVRTVSSYSKDPSPEVRAAAVTGMIRFGGLDGILESAEALEEMVSSPEAAARELAARVLGETGLPGFYQLLLNLLGDDDLAVQRAAITAAGALRSPELVPSLIYKLGHPRLGGAATDALARYGPGIETALSKVIELETERPSIRLGVPGVLGRLGTQRASTILMRHLDTPDDNLRTRVARWLNRLHTRFPALSLDRARLRRAAESEIRQAYVTLRRIEELSLGDAPLAEGGLLVLALKERLLRTVDRIFLLLGLRFHGKTLEAVRSGLDSSNRAVRGNALEVLENSLDRDTRARLMPLLDERDLREKLAAGRALYDLGPYASRDAAVEELCTDPSPWIRACAVHYLTKTRRIPDQALGDIARVLMASPEPMVREVALAACSLHLSPKEASCLVKNGRLDIDSGVRGVASALAGARSDGEGDHRSFAG